MARRTNSKITRLHREAREQEQDTIADLLARAGIPQVCVAFDDRVEIQAPTRGVVFGFDTAGRLRDVGRLTVS